MHWERIVELHPGGSRGMRGSGYQIAPGVVLTAQHVAEGLAETRVRFLMPDEDGLPGDAGPWQDARVVWSGGDVDLALLVPRDRTAFREGASKATIARLDGRAPVRVDALGFPEAMLDENRSDTLQIEGVINPWTGVRGESLMVRVQTAHPGDDDDWQGMSGAALFAGDRLVGVIQKVPVRFEETIAATPAHLLFDDPGAARILKDAGVVLAERLVDAAYVDRLPRTGQWGGLREQYTRAVVTTLCRVDHVGFAVGGVPDSKTPALAVFTGWRLKPQGDLATLARTIAKRYRPIAGFL